MISNKSPQIPISHYRASCSDHASQVAQVGSGFILRGCQSTSQTLTWEMGDLWRSHMIWILSSLLEMTPWSQTSPIGTAKLSVRSCSSHEERCQNLRSQNFYLFNEGYIIVLRQPP